MRTEIEEHFINLITLGFTIGAAAQQIGISRSRIYQIRDSDQTFRERWEGAAAHFKDSATETFLEHLAHNGSVVDAARIADVPVRTLYSWRKSDQEFAGEWEVADLAYTDGVVRSQLLEELNRGNVTERTYSERVQLDSGETELQIVKTVTTTKSNVTALLRYLALFHPDFRR